MLIPSPVLLNFNKFALLQVGYSNLKKTQSMYSGSLNSTVLNCAGSTDTRIFFNKYLYCFGCAVRSVWMWAGAKVCIDRWLLWRGLELPWILVSTRRPGITPQWVLRGNWYSSIWGESKIIRGFWTALGEPPPLISALFKGHLYYLSINCNLARQSVNANVNAPPLDPRPRPTSLEGSGESCVRDDWPPGFPAKMWMLYFFMFVCNGTVGHISPF